MYLRRGKPQRDRSDDESSVAERRDDERRDGKLSSPASLEEHDSQAPGSGRAKKNLIRPNDRTVFLVADLLDVVVPQRHGFGAVSKAARFGRRRAPRGFRRK
jgi:hypothetical protein